MPGVPSLTAFAGLGPPWSLAQLDANFTNISNLLKSANNYAICLTDTGGANSYAVTFSGGVTFSQSAFVGLTFKAANANTGASTLAVNGGGGVAIVNPNGGALLAGQISSGAIVNVIYDGSNWILVGASTSNGQRNVIINGAFNFVQNPSIVNHNPTANAVSYMMQRWYNYQNGGTTGDMAVAQLLSGPATDGAFTNAFKYVYPYCVRVTRSAGAAITDSRYKTVLPTAISRTLANQRLQLSFFARAGSGYSAAALALPVLLITGTGTDQSATSVESGGWTGQATTYSSSVTLTTSWQEFHLTISALPTTTTQIALGFHPVWVGAVAPANDYFEIAGVRLAPRQMVDSPILEVPPDEDEMRCFEFFETLNGLAASNTAIASGFFNTTTVGWVTIPFQPKRTTPALSVSAAAHFVLQNAAANDAATVFTFAANSIGRSASRGIVTIGTGRTAGQGVTLAAGSTSARVYVDAEF